MLSSLRNASRLASPVGARMMSIVSRSTSAPVSWWVPLPGTMKAVGQTSIGGAVQRGMVPMQDLVRQEEYQMDSVMRKRKSKMKKHKLRKRRKREKAEKRKQSQG